MLSFAISSRCILEGFVVIAFWGIIAFVNIRKAVKKSRANALNRSKMRAVVNDFFDQQDSESKTSDDAHAFFQDDSELDDAYDEAEQEDEPEEEEYEDEEEDGEDVSPTPAYVPLAQQEAPSIVHARAHINSPADMGTVAPPPPTPATPTSSSLRNIVSQPLVTTVGARHVRHLPPVRLSRSRRALRNAMMYREVLSKPRAFYF